MNDQNKRSIDDALSKGHEKIITQAGGMLSGKEPTLAARVASINIMTFKQGAEAATGEGAGTPGMLLASFVALESVVAGVVEEAGQNKAKFIGSTLEDAQLKTAEKYLAQVTKIEDSVQNKILPTIDEQLSVLRVKYDPPKDPTEATLMGEIRAYLRALPDWKAKRECWQQIVASGDTLSMRAIFTAPIFMRESLLGVTAGPLLDATIKDQIEKRKPGAIGNIDLTQKGLSLISEALQRTRADIMRLTGVRIGLQRSQMSTQEKAEYQKTYGFEAYNKLQY